ncbi:MAG: hypothetical protein ACI81R_000262 [Bradymonadia bacterium]|jgi:hypothetical protein
MRDSCTTQPARGVALRSSRRRSLWPLAWLLLAACASDAESVDDHSVQAAALANFEGAGALVVESEGSAESGEAVLAAPEQPELASEVVLPEELVVLEASAGATLGPPGGDIVAGGAAVRIPSGALPSAKEITLTLHDSVDQIERPIGGSLPLASLSGAPWNPMFERAVQVEVPLLRRVEPGMMLELLAYHPAMRSYLVIGRARANSDGTGATFPVRQLGDMVVRAAPVRASDADERCAVPTMGLEDAWPGPREDVVVGLVEEHERIPRRAAFALLSDYRLREAFERVEFKNEEVNNLSATSRNERAHVDEDFLMDPNAAVAVARLADLVRAEWVDPITGESAIRVRITESYDALIEHSHRSTHYQGRAIDLTLTPIPAPAPRERREMYGRLSSLSVCAGFDYVLFENQFHVHASVLPTMVDMDIAMADGSTESRRVPLAALARATQVPQMLADAVAPSPRAMDGLRELVVHDGQVFLVNPSGLPPLGSTNEDGTPIDVDYPLAVSDAHGSVLRAGFSSESRALESDVTSPN